MRHTGRLPSAENLSQRPPQVELIIHRLIVVSTGHLRGVRRLPLEPIEANRPTTHRLSFTP